MLKLPKGLKKKKKGKKSKKKEEELFTEEELEKYRQEHQQQAQAQAQAQAAGEGSAQENEEWSKFKDLTTGVDSVLRKTQGDLDRIKSTSFFQRVPAGPKEVNSVGQAVPQRPTPSVRHGPARVSAPVQLTEADFPQLAQAAQSAQAAEAEPSDSGSEDDDQDDIFDTSYVDAVERGEVKLAYVPDSPEDAVDDLDIFDTSHVDAIIKGQEVKVSKGKKALDIGVAVEVLTGRIDNVALPTTKRSKRVIPGDLLLENVDPEVSTNFKAIIDPVPQSILDVDEDLPVSSEPIDLSISLHTVLIQQNKQVEKPKDSEEEVDEFTLLATESLEVNAEVVRLEEKIQLEPVIEESWSAFEADKNEAVFAESIVEDQIDFLDPYLELDDPFDTSFAETVIPAAAAFTSHTAPIALTSAFEEDDDFDPRAEENQHNLNNRRKSSVRIHLTDPSGLRESITSDDLNDKESKLNRDLLGGSTTDLSLIGDSPLNPVDVINDDYDPFDTTAIDKIVAPGKGELKLLEKELIGETAHSSLYRVPSDPEFDPRAEEPGSVQQSQPQQQERRASRPENLIVSKNVAFCVKGDSKQAERPRPPKPVTPYYIRDVSIGEEVESETLHRTKSDEDLAPKLIQQSKRRHSEYPHSAAAAPCGASELLDSGLSGVTAKVLTPIAPRAPELPDVDPFDTSFAADIAPGKGELKLLAREFSCEDSQNTSGERDLLEPSDDIFQVKALTPEPTSLSRVPEIDDFDPFDTTFASDLHPGRSELKLLESEFLN